MSEYAELRAQAKSLGINTFHMSKDAMLEAIAAAEAAGIKPVKKGNKSWAWRNRLDVANKDSKFRYRMVSREETNLRDKMADGWEFVNPVTGIPGEHIDPRQIADGEPLEGAQTYRDLVLMALPEEKAQQRDAAVAELTRQQTAGLKNMAQSEARKIGPDAEVHGSITIIE